MPYVTPSRRNRDRRDQRIVELRRRGLSLAAIAFEVGCAASTASNVLRRQADGEPAIPVAMPRVARRGSVPEGSRGREHGAEPSAPPWPAQGGEIAGEVIDPRHPW